MSSWGKSRGGGWGCIVMLIAASPAILAALLTALGYVVGRVV